MSLVIAIRAFERSDVAPLAADDAALHLVRWQMHDADRVLGRVVGRHPLHSREDDVASLVLGFFSGRALDGAGELHRVVLGLDADGVEQDGLGVVGAHPGNPLEGDDLVLRRTGEVVLGLVDLPFPLQQLAISLFEHLGPLIELLVPLDQSTFLGAQLVAARPRLFLGLACEAQLLVLRFEDELFLAGPSLGFDAAGLGLGGLHALGCPHRAAEGAQ
jgi:hypothetical protein